MDKYLQLHSCSGLEGWPPKIGPQGTWYMGPLGKKGLVGHNQVKDPKMRLSWIIQEDPDPKISAQRSDREKTHRGRT